MHDRDTSDLSVLSKKASTELTEPDDKTLAWNIQNNRPVPVPFTDPSADIKCEKVVSNPDHPIAKAASRPSVSIYHRRGVRSTDAIPRQTIMKALASRPPSTMTAGSSSLAISSKPDDPHYQPHGNRPRSISTATAPGSINSTHNNSEFLIRGNMRGRFTAALSNMDIDLQGVTPLSASKLAVLASPCFYHKRFDDAVNIDRVLEEIQADETMSHSRLMQTATGVREVSKQLQRRPLRRAVKTIMVITKVRDNELVRTTREVAEWLLSTPRYGSDVGVTVYVDSKLRKSKRFDAPGLVAKDARFVDMLQFWTPKLCSRTPEIFDLVLTLGGDGTVLYTSWLFQRIVPPILSFNLGSLGFLTSFRIEQYKKTLNGLMGDEGMRVSLRMRFTCTVYRCHNADKSKSKSSGKSVALSKPFTKSKSDNVWKTPAEAEQFEVLNELVIDRGPSPYVSNLELYGDDSLLTVIQADGCIFSTPTGSTAYSLSAGGSLVHPDIPAILLTPICPHTLSFRPMLLNDTMLLRVAVPKGSRASAYCSFDGKGRVELRQGDYVTIAVSQYPFPTVMNKHTDWFDSVSRTLRWNSRGAQQKGWGGGGGGNVISSDTGGAGGEDEDGEANEDEEEEEEYDIDFGDDDADSLDEVQEGSDDRGSHEVSNPEKS